MLLKNVIKADGWSKWSESWENPAYKKTDRISEFKQRILDDLIQEAKFVRVDDSDAYNFGGGAAGRGQGIEIPISPPQKPWKKRRAQTKRTGSLGQAKRPQGGPGANGLPKGLQVVFGRNRSDVESENEPGHESR